MNKSTISVDVFLDEQKIPEKMSWSATQSTMDEPQEAKAMMLSFWDGKEKAAMRIDLWTKDMMMDETQTTSRESNTPFYLSLKTIYFPSLATNPEVYSYRLSIASAY